LPSESFGINTAIAKTTAKNNPANNKIRETFDSPVPLKRKLKTSNNPERIVIKTKPTTDSLPIIDHTSKENKVEYNTKC